MAIAKYVQIGENIEYVAAKAIEYMEVVAFGEGVGIAQDAIAKGESGTITLKGVFDIPADQGAIEAGAAVFFDTKKGVIVAAKGENTVPAGIAVAAKAAAANTARVKIG